MACNKSLVALCLSFMGGCKKSHAACDLAVANYSLRTIVVNFGLVNKILLSLWDREQSLVI